SMSRGLTALPMAAPTTATSTPAAPPSETSTFDPSPKRAQGVASRGTPEPQNTPGELHLVQDLASKEFHVFDPASIRVVSMEFGPRSAMAFNTGRFSAEVQLPDGQTRTMSGVYGGLQDNLWGGLADGT